MSNISSFLIKEGICEVPELYSSDEIAALNAAIDPLLASRIEQRRAYVHIDEMMELGVLNSALSKRMQDVLFSIIPDPVLYHCHIYEIAANDTRSHIFSDSLVGWHRDPDSEYLNANPSHVSIFVYLKDVGADDGAFEFVPGVPPTIWLRNGAPFISVRGPAGFSFAWHRNYYHRASPNRGPVRRRLLKISIQANAFESEHLKNPNFTKVIAGIAPGDVKMDLLLGRYQGKQSPTLPPAVEPKVLPIESTGHLNLSTVDLTKAQVRDKAFNLKRRLRGQHRKQAVAAYD